MRTTLQKYLFFAYILLLPTQLGTYFFFDFSYVSGVKIDYLAPALFLTDLVAFALIFSHIKALQIFFNKKILGILITLLIPIFFSFNPWIGFYKWLKIIEVIAIYAIFQNKKINTQSLLPSFLIGATVEAALSLFHVVTGSSVQNIFYYLGERAFTIATPGIATIALNGVEILRPYGTFSHPNSMAGFYLALYTFVLFLSSDHQNKLIRHLALLLSSLIVLFSFSKVAIIGFLIVTIFYTLKQTFSTCMFCSISKIVVIFILSAFFLQSTGDPDSIEKRIYLFKSSLQIIQNHFFTGVGLGNYLYAQGTFSNPYPYFFLEPVHNVFLLITAEIGIPLIGFITYVIFPFLKKLWKNEATISLLFVIIFTGMFDHYWATLQQNILLLPVIFGLLQKHKDMLK